MEDIPLIEFDDDRTALIEPSKLLISKLLKGNTLPEHCVLPFYGSVIERLGRDGKLEKIHSLSTSGASLISIDVYRTIYRNSTIAVVFPGLGAPFSVAIIEELITLGCRKFVACGSGGVLKSELRRGTIVIPSCAVRDEGTSYHYVPPSRTIDMASDVVKKMEAVLKKNHVKYEIGKTWTTDALYRETKGKIARRKAEGCVMVEMECSAMLAVARFRKVIFGQYLGAGDDVSGDEWDPRRTRNRHTFQEKLFWLSVEAVNSL